MRGCVRVRVWRVCCLLRARAWRVGAAARVCALAPVGCVLWVLCVCALCACVVCVGLGNVGFTKGGNRGKQKNTVFLSYH